MPESLRILAVDLSHLYRARWEANAGKNDQGQAAFTATVQAVVDARAGYDRVAICCDSGPSFRRTIAPTYKAHRERPPAAFYAQQDRAIERLAADVCSVFKAPEMGVDEAGDGPRPTAYYFEADDVIGALCQWANGAGHHVTILGGDKDLLALISDAIAGVDVLRPDSPPPVLPGDTEAAKTWSAEAVRASPKIGVLPALIPSWLALCGDDSDGIEGFAGWTDPPEKGGGKHPGIGGVTAAKLLNQFSDLAGVFVALDEQKIKGHVAEVLRRHGWARAELGLNLATIRRDVPLDFSPLLAEPVTKPIAETKARHFDAASAETVIEGEPVADKPAPPRASTALARVDFDPLALQPRDLGQLETMALIAFNSRCYGQFQNYEQVMMCMAEARERGIPLGTALRNAYIVKGKLAWSAAFLTGLVLTSGKAEYFEITETTSQRAVVSYQRKGRPAGTFPFTIEEARDAGWIKSDGKWETNPRTMLRWAALREAARAFFADVVSGMYTPDELRGGHVEDAEWENAA